MKKRRMIVFGMVMVFLLTACSAGAGMNVSASTADESWEVSSEPMEAGGWGNGSSAASSELEVQEINTYQGTNVKRIFRASLSIETLDFEGAAAGLGELVNSLGGYFESSSVYQGGYYAEAYLRNGSYTVRVPSGQYENFLSAVSEDENCHVTQLDRTTENVGEAYYDAETRLKTQQIKLERLQDLLSRAELMEDIIALESEISSVEYEIERLSSTLNRYDGLIDFATIEVYLRQVARLSDMPEENEGLGTRLLRGVQMGAIEFGDGMSAFMVWCAYHLIGIVLFVIVVIFAVRIVRKKLRSGTWGKGPKNQRSEADKAD